MRYAQTIAHFDNVELPMTGPFCRIVQTYPDLIETLRERAHQLEFNWSELDRLAGNCDGWASKTLSRTGAKVLGPKSFIPTLGALGLHLLVVEDTAATALTLRRRVPADRAMQAVALDAHARRRQTASGNEGEI